MAGLIVNRVDIPGFPWVADGSLDCAVVDQCLRYAVAVFTDRLLGQTVPLRGLSLYRLSKFWRDYLSFIVDSDVVSDDAGLYLPYLGLIQGSEWAERLRQRTSLVRVTDEVPIDFHVGEYDLSGRRLKKPFLELLVRDKVTGLSRSLEYEEMIEYLKAWNHARDFNILAQALRGTSLALYALASKYARGRGYIITDTVFRFGLINGTPVLVGPVLTPDTCQYWPLWKYTDGVVQKPYDKEPLMDWLVSGVVAKDKAKAIRETMNRCLAITKRLTR